jgi:lipoate-protein ligase A
MVDARGRSGPENMRIDEALLDEVVQSGNAFLRLYRWDPPTLSIGRNQPIPPLDVPVVRRPTGGQAVWHEHEVTYAVAAPIALFGSLRHAYEQIHQRLADALQSLGVDARLARRPLVPPAMRHPSCFASAVGGEIVVGGKKLVGSAQRRRRDALLQHGSILLEGSQQPIVADGGETTLAAVLGRPVSFEEVVDAIVATWPSVIASLVAE